MLPFVKWAGGKRQFLSKIIEKAPSEFNHYYEPFVGGGAVLFGLNHQPSTINDINSHLIHTYKVIRDEHEKLIETIDKFDKIPLNDEKYKEFRSLYNDHILNNTYNIETAALFIYINKHAFNGLFRVNSKGLYNVPWNKKELVKSYNQDNMIEISRFLKNVTILNTDFSEALNGVKKGDFVFFDSPYAPLKPTSFTSYDKAGFKLEDHVRLADLFKQLSSEGVYCMLTNHNTELIRELYSDFEKEEINVRRNINSDASKRVGKELIITNY
ncbi:Dam family site-specific DNA-(adenine-N6)-methyltransferase [Staphylococcus pseudintermedius]|uniref:site-specific DNA-methyltransferase (adenine-specific) n=1 Tax=Staphylococcus pseudintermedius TaxID=283734 RepID=A0A8H9BWW0_STAPS|nr:Dam family site-specific DNA-(adenine-N6)-methyltransferase [Staphylococcus pseudintermedius]EGQ0316509.1 Dam family site-specific DNA-(adenine-N6)-methyltransferase [Staphylococcus pseudintermedius]EGQ0318155.1 Dam family site-specific DNA-(adenine-N6)-methyltransferase [Staphylococcus pseudintermedius]EGQ0380005.1 Dam family site-specific DNA-(adenine-N6)-methyltransferase [Staphylococcus pseudintermedius]EGQ0385022.1 Dam family site-specific DNA-(adenine-N6)-methyltransferase [Staphylococ